MVSDSEVSQGSQEKNQSKEEKGLVELVRRNGELFRKGENGLERIYAVPINGGPYMVELQRNGQNPGETLPTYQKRMIHKNAPPKAVAFLPGMESKNGLYIAIDYFTL